MKNKIPTEPIVRQLCPKTRVIDEGLGIVEYVASDESLDSYHEIIKASGWRFDKRFVSNPVFLNTHQNWGIDKLLGKVIKWEVRDGKLIEQVQWAIDVEENAMAKLGFEMTAKGYLKAVSVGFMPVKMAWRGDDDFTEVLDSLRGLTNEDRDQVRVVYLEQQQFELSSCVIGANPAALSKAFNAGDITEERLASVGFDSDASFESLKNAAAICNAPGATPEIQRLAGLSLEHGVSRTLLSGTDHAPSSQRRSGDGGLPNRSTESDKKKAERRKAERREKIFADLDSMLSDLD